MLSPPAVILLTAQVAVACALAVIPAYPGSYLVADEEDGSLDEITEALRRVETSQYTD